MADDREAWCDERLEVASGNPRMLREATVYYYRHIVGRFLRADGRRRHFETMQETILHKLDVLKLTSIETTTARLNAVLRSHPSTISWVGRHTPWDLASRLQDSAENDLRCMLADAYRLGCDKLVIYGLVGSGPAGSGGRGSGTSRGPDRSS
jgi:hypothetical protein